MRNSWDILPTSPDNMTHWWCLMVSVRPQKTPANAIWCQQEAPRILEQPFGLPGTVCWCRLVSISFCWCLLLSWIVPRYLEEVIVNIRVKCMYVFGVWMCVRVFWSAQALSGATNALYWKYIKRQNSTHLTLLKHQNTKTSLYKLSKNHWVCAFFEFYNSQSCWITLYLPVW